MQSRKLIPLLILGGLALALTATQPIIHALGNQPESGTFFDTNQTLGSRLSVGVALADLDGDADLDAFVANQQTDNANAVWLNNGSAFFTSSGQDLGNAESEDVALADVDGINGIDAVVANSDGLNQVWLNDGTGTFTAGQAFDPSPSRGVALGDLDGDADPDVFFANGGAGQPNTVWLNQGGVFTDTGQNLSTGNSYAVTLGDLDGDGDLDAFVANGGGVGEPNRVWINQGGVQAGTPGDFLDSGQSLGFAWTYAVALGDLDGDGDLDVFAANWFPAANKVWINQGGAQGGTEGVFLDSGQNLGSAGSLGIALADVDDDADLDAFVTNNFPEGNKVWLNDGNGTFTDSGQALGTDDTHYDVALADLDGDTDPDAFVASFNSNRVYRNGPPGLPAATFAVARETNTNGDDVYYHATSGDALIPVMLNHTVTETLDVHARIEITTTVITATLTFDPGEQMDYLNLINPDPDPNETYTLTLSVTPEGIPPIPADETDRILFVFVDGGQGMDDCILCYIEWLGQFVGIDPIFDQLHHMSLEDQMASPLWPYYTALFDLNSPEMSTIVAANPPILWNALVTLDDWTPAVQALSDGNGASYTVTQEMVDDLDGLIDEIEAEASPALQAAIQKEQDALDLPSLGGINMDEFWTEVQARRPISQLYLSIILK